MIYLWLAGPGMQADVSPSLSLVVVFIVFLSKAFLSTIVSASKISRTVFLPLISSSILSPSPCIQSRAPKSKKNS